MSGDREARPPAPAPGRCLIRNIPSDLKLGDIRYFFQDFVESERFAVFHFLEDLDFDSPTASTKEAEVKFCCLVTLRRAEEVNSFAATFNKREWETKGGNPCGSLCYIVDVDKEMRVGEAAFTEFLRSLLGRQTPPPPALPNGNIGTPVKIVRESVRKSLIPSRALAKLGIDFREYKEEQHNSKYSRAKLEYERENLKGMDQLLMEESAARVESLSSDVEDWDRWEAAHGDEEDEEEHYLYEEKIEKKWEKGGSGLVHYTDAIYWNKMKGEKEELEMLKEHGDDWALHLDPEIDSKYPLRGLSGEQRKAILRERKRMLSENDLKESKEKREEAEFFERAQKKARLLEETEHLLVKKPKDLAKFSRFHLFEPELRQIPSAPSKNPDASPHPKKQKGQSIQPNFNRMSVKYMESHGWRPGEPIGQGLSSPLDVRPIVARQGIGFQDDEKRPQVSRLHKDLEQRFVKSQSATTKDESKL